MVASESVALDSIGFEFIADVAPGEAVYIDGEGELHIQKCAKETKKTPCIFEFVYFARPDSIIDGISVYKARLRMGDALARRIEKERPNHDNDVVIPIPDTSRTSALQLANRLGVNYREGFIKNRYIGRTFIMPGQKQRKKSVRQKLNAIDLEFKNKTVLLVDDSIVRGTTCNEIIEMARDAGAKKVYFASAAPEVKFPNVYGIDMPTAKELIAYGRSTDEICQSIGADWLVYQDLDDLINATKTKKSDVQEFDCSVFNGCYITGDIDQAYLDALEDQRSDAKKASRQVRESSIVDMHNDDA
jgi:amidophosphoribosyltransferase